MPSNQFYSGETAVFNIEIRNQFSRDLVDPDSVQITIVNDEVVVDGENMDKSSTGVYTYNFTAEITGIFTATYKVTDGGIVTIAKDQINIIN